MKSKRPTFPLGVNIFVVRDDKLLLGKRKGVGNGLWGLPGGHLEDRESMKAAAARELHEETGLIAQDFKFVGLVNDPRQDNTHYLQTGFLAKNITGEMDLKEPEMCSEWRWFSLDELPDNIFYGHTKLIQNFKDKVSFGET